MDNNEWQKTKVVESHDRLHFEGTRHIEEQQIFTKQFWHSFQYLLYR